MSRRYESTVSLDTPGYDEDEYAVRGTVDVEMTGRGLTAFLDGDAQVLVDDEWLDVEDAGLCDRDRERVRDALSGEALEDDSDECDREERDDRRAEGWR